VDVGTVVLLIAPVLLAGTVEGVVIVEDWLPRLRAIPLDCGMSMRGQRVFGTNKTLRGAVVMIVGTATFAGLLYALAAPFEPTPAYGWIGFGSLMGLAYVVAELPNSFVKRQLGIAPGATTERRWRVVQYVVDQGDSVVGVVAMLALVTDLPPVDLLGVLVVGVIVHAVFDAVRQRMGAKRTVRS
jgi:hypothetical protein